MLSFWVSSFSVIQWNLVIKRLDMTKPSYNKVFGGGGSQPFIFIWIFFFFTLI